MNKPLRVLIIEDSVPDAELLLNELRRGGFEPTYEIVDTAEAMNEALDNQSWDIVLADYVMPNFGALEALELLKARGVDIPFIVVSGKIGEDVAVEAMRAGANDYLLKGNLARLVPAIERELQDAVVRRERRQAQEERDRLLEKVREINGQLVVTSLKAQEQSAELDAIIDSIAEGLIIYGPSGKIVRMNPHARALLGFATAQYTLPVAERWSALQAETEDGKPFQPEDLLITRALRGETVHGEVMSILHPTEHKRIWLSVSTAPIIVEAGKISGAVLTVTDITSLREAEKAQ